MKSVPVTRNSVSLLKRPRHVFARGKEIMRFDLSGSAGSFGLR